jgi:hypothetical protein
MVYGRTLPRGPAVTGTKMFVAPLKLIESTTGFWALEYAATKKRDNSAITAWTAVRVKDFIFDFLLNARGSSRPLCEGCVESLPLVLHIALFGPIQMRCHIAPSQSVAIKIKAGSVQAPVGALAATVIGMPSTLSTPRTLTPSRVTSSVDRYPLKPILTVSFAFPAAINRSSGFASGNI